MSKRVVLLTYFRLLGECLAAAIRQADSDIRIDWVEEADAAFGVDGEKRPDVVIIDVDSVNSFTPDEARRLANRYPATRILIIGKARNELDIIAYLEAGASDYRVVTNLTVQDLVDGIHDIVDGRVDNCSPQRLHALIMRLRELSAVTPTFRANGDCTLTKREMEILRLIEKGSANKQIARELYISLYTVKNHVHRILQKLNVSSRQEAVHFAHERSWLKVGAQHDED